MTPLFNLQRSNVLVGEEEDVPEPPLPCGKPLPGAFFEERRQSIPSQHLSP